MGGGPPSMVTEPSSICARWNSEKAIGSTGSRSTWLTWSRSMLATASYQSECMAAMRRRSESSTAGSAIRSLLGQLGPGPRGDVPGVGSAADGEHHRLDRPGERERPLVVVDHGRQRVAPDVEPGRPEHAHQLRDLGRGDVRPVDGQAQDTAPPVALEADGQLVAP